jgi:LAO/AO transport system kinase
MFNTTKVDLTGDVIIFGLLGPQYMLKRKSKYLRVQLTALTLLNSLVNGVLRSDRVALARAITIVDNDEPDSHALMQKIFSKTGNARTVGFTGPAGGGKSTLIGKLVSEFQTLGYKTAILAVDPSSPLTGGAILGDRVRMQPSLNDDDAVFMRSLASRGSLGGTSKSLRNVIRVLDAAGYRLIVVESVGAGQLELAISKAVNFVVVVLTPQTGDRIQAIKAGLNEIGDLYVINKGDLEGATSLYNSILDFVGSRQKTPMVMKTSAKTGQGIKSLAMTIDKALNSKNVNYKEKEKEMIESELKDLVLDIINQKTGIILGNNNMYRDLVNKLVHKKMDPYRAAKLLSAIILK